MRKIVLSLLIISILLAGYLFFHFKTNKVEEGNVTFSNIEDFYIRGKYSKNLQPKDLNPKSFIKLFTEKYNKDSKLNFVTLFGDFPENWIKPTDIQYLMSVMRSKEKCCGYMNTFSSTISIDHAEIGGFATLFLNSYISNTKINMGLNCNPKTDEESVRKIKNWYQNSANKN